MGTLTLLMSENVPAHSHPEGALARTQPPPALTVGPDWGCSGGCWPGFGQDCQTGSFAELRFEQQMFLGQDWFVVVPPLQCPRQTSVSVGALRTCWIADQAWWQNGQSLELRAKEWPWPQGLWVGAFSSHRGVLWNVSVLGLSSSATAHCSSLWLLLLWGKRGALAEGSTVCRGSHQLCLQTEEFLFLEKVMAKMFWSWSVSFHYRKN